MKKRIALLIMMVLFCSASMSARAADRSIFIHPEHGGLDYGFEINGQHEKDLNLSLALKLGQYLENSTYSRKTDQLKTLTETIEQIKKHNPDLIISIQHHGKQAAFIEYNPAASTIAYQLGAYFASEEVPYRFLRFRGAYLFAQPQPVILLIISPEIAAEMNLEFIAQLLKGL